MYKLYGIDSCCNSGRKSNCVVIATDKEDAIREFYKDPNCRNYNMIEGIHEIKGNKCTLLYQIRRDIVDFEEKEWELGKIEIGKGTWGRNGFSLICKDINEKLEKLEFKSDLVHSNGSEIELMICIADYKPNWITLEENEYE